MAKDFRKFLCYCVTCNRKTNKAYAKTHFGQCKYCATGIDTAMKDSGQINDTYHDYIASGARAAGVSFSDC